MLKKLSYLIVGILFVVFFVITNITEAKRYGYTIVPFGATGDKLCNTDGDSGDPKCVTTTSNNISGSSTCPSSVDISPTLNGNMRCWKWDATPPTVTSSVVGGAGIWINNDRTKLMSTETGGSGIKYQKYRWDNSACTAGLGFTTGMYITLLEGKHTLYLCAEDNAGNTFSTSIVYWVDRTSPDINDLTVTLDGKNPGGNVLANDNGQLQFNYTDAGNGAPIIIKYKLEDKNTASLGVLISVDHSSPPNTTVSWDVSLIDNYMLTNGSRLYNTKVKLCDKAGNCSSLNDYDWNLYANTPLNHEIFDFSDFQNTKVGNNDDIFTGEILLKDEYGNVIVPSNTINRNISINLMYNNEVYLNQYELSDGGGIFYRMKNSPVYTSLDIGIFTGSKLYTGGIFDGDYSFNLKSYVPTYDGYDKANGKLIILGVNYIVTDNLLLNVDKTEYISPIESHIKFSPIIYDEISRLPPLASEGIQKDFDLEVKKNGVVTTYSAFNIMMNYNSNGEPIDTLLKKNSLSHSCLYATQGGSLDDNWMSCQKWATSMSFNSLYEFSEGFYLQTGSVLNPENIGFISTHIKTKYKDGKEAVWNSALVGRTNFNYNPTDETFSTQSPVNIIGMIGSTSYDKLNQVLEGEAPTIGGSVNKSTLRKDINVNVSELVRGQDGIFTNSEELTDIFDFGMGEYFMDRDVKVFYYHGDSNPKVILPEKTGFTEKYLLIVEGGDVYLSGNLQQDGGMLGIISLRRNDKGGNIYVQKDITNIDALMYADGAIISYVGNPIGENFVTQESMSQSELKNQLYIRGLLWSFNTLGASRSNTPYCPYFYPDDKDCTLIDAQKYDLEYFRRFYLVKPTVYDSTADINAWFPYYSPQALLAGGVSCELQDSGLDGNTDLDIACTSSNYDLVNRFGISASNPKIYNPFGGDGVNINSSQMKNAAPIILEYDSRFQNNYMPIFTNMVN